MKLQRHTITTPPGDGKLRAPQGGAICLGGEEISAGRLIPRVPFSEWRHFTFQEVRDSPVQVWLGGTQLLVNLRQCIRDNFLKFARAQYDSSGVLQALRAGPLEPLPVYLMVHTDLEAEVSLDEIQQTRGAVPGQMYLASTLKTEISLFTAQEAPEGTTVDTTKAYTFETGGVIPHMIGGFPPESLPTEVFFAQYLRQTVVPLGQKVLWGC